MNPFHYQRASSEQDALAAITRRDAKFLAGGTNLVDLMRYDVEHPSTLIDVTNLLLTGIEVGPSGGLWLERWFGIANWRATGAS